MCRSHVTITLSIMPSWHMKKADMCSFNTCHDIWIYMCSEFRYELQQCPCPAQRAQDTHIMTYRSLYFYTYIHYLLSVYSPYHDLKCLKTLPLVTAGELSSGAVKCGRQLRRWIKQDLRTVNNLYSFPMINLYCFSLLCHKLVIPGALVTYNLTFLG